MERSVTAAAVLGLLVGLGVAVAGWTLGASRRERLPLAACAHSPPRARHRGLRCLMAAP